MATAVYLLCAVTSALCAVLLLREFRRRGTRLLLWSSLSFAGFAVSNSLVFTDFVLWPERDLTLIRSLTACGAVALLVFGLVWDLE